MTYAEIVEKWNKSADGFNQWADLGEDEKIEFAFGVGWEEGIIEAIKTHKEVTENYDRHNNGKT